MWFSILKNYINKIGNLKYHSPITWRWGLDTWKKSCVGLSYILKSRASTYPSLLLLITLVSLTELTLMYTCAHARAHIHTQHTHTHTSNKQNKPRNTYLNLAGERGVGGNIPGSKESK